ISGTLDTVEANTDRGRVLGVRETRCQPVGMPQADAMPQLVHYGGNWIEGTYAVCARRKGFVDGPAATGAVTHGAGEVIPCRDRVEKVWLHRRGIDRTADIDEDHVGHS